MIHLLLLFLRLSPPSSFQFFIHCRTERMRERRRRKHIKCVLDDLLVE